MIMAVTSKLYIRTLTINIGANSQVYRCVGENEIQRIMLKKKKLYLTLQSLKWVIDYFNEQNIG